MVFSLVKDRAKSELKIIEDGDESFTGDVVGAFIGGFIGGIIAGPLGAFLGYNMASGISEAMPEVVSEVTSRLFPKLSLLRIKPKKEKLSEIQIIWGRLIEKLFSDTIKELKVMYEREYGVPLGWFDALLEDDVLNVKEMESESLYEILNGLMLKREEIDIFRFLPEPHNENLHRFVRENFPIVLKKNFEGVIRAKAVEVEGKRISLRLFFLEFVKVSLEYFEKELESIKNDVAELESRVSKHDETLIELTSTIMEIKGVIQDLEPLRELLYHGQNKILGIEGVVKRRRNELLGHPFYGRDRIIQEVMDFVESNSGKLIITGIAGVGKSTLMANLAKRLRDSGRYHVIDWYFDSTTGITNPKDALVHIYLHLVLVKRETKKLPVLDDKALTIEELERMIMGVLSDLTPRKKIVILIDALDEANELFYPFGRELPENLVVIASTRESPQNLSLPQEPSTKWRYIEFWRENSKIIELNYLSYEAGRELVFHKLSKVQDKKTLEEVSRKIFEITNGYPLYLKFLLEELEELETSNTKAIFERIREIPQSFEEYLDKELVAMEGLVDNPEFVDYLFALLAILKEPMELGDIGNVLKRVLKGGKKVRKRVLKRVPNKIKRWLRVRRKGSKEYWSLQHESLRENFVRILSDEVEEVTENLLCFCSRWEEKEYCLKHYPEHLYEAGRYDELLELVKNREFLEVQKRVGGTPLVFHTLEIAMDAAVVREDLAELLEVAFIYNRAYNGANRMSLLEHYKRYGLEATWELIKKNPDLKVRYKMILLLSVYLMSIGEEEKAKDLLIGSMGLLSGDDKELLTVLLEFWEFLPSEGKIRGVLSLLGEGINKISLISTLALLSGEYILALELVDQVEDPWERAMVLALISWAFAISGDSDKALELVDQIREPQDRIKALTDIAVIFIGFGELDKALEIVSKIEDSRDQVEVLVEIVKALGRIKPPQYSLINSLLKLAISFSELSFLAFVALYISSTKPSDRLLEIFIREVEKTLGIKLDHNS